MTALKLGETKLVLTFFYFPKQSHTPDIMAQELTDAKKCRSHTGDTVTPWVVNLGNVQKSNLFFLVAIVH